MPTRNEGQKGLCAQEPHRALLSLSPHLLETALIAGGHARGAFEKLRSLCRRGSQAAGTSRSLPITGASRGPRTRHLWVSRGNGVDS